MIKGQRGEVKLVGLFGSESIGKTSTSYMLTGRLRTHGLLAEVVTDSSAAMPFPPGRFDTHEAAWVYVLLRKIERECEYALRSNVELVVSDRTPLDLLAYFWMKHPGSRMPPALEPLVQEWMRRYDLLYFFPAEGTAYRCDEFREPTDQSRQTIDAYFRGKLEELQVEHGSRLRVASGTYRERAEFVYHDILAEVLGDTKPKRVVEQLRSLIAKVLGPVVTEVRILGSRSVTRAHVASDTDDFDVLVVVDDTRSAEACHFRLQSAQEWLEACCEASLDIKVVNAKDMPHEV